MFSLFSVIQDYMYCVLIVIHTKVCDTLVHFLQISQYLWRYKKGSMAPCCFVQETMHNVSEEISVNNTYFISIQIQVPAYSREGLSSWLHLGLLLYYHHWSVRNEEISAGIVSDSECLTPIPSAADYYILSEIY